MSLTEIVSGILPVPTGKWDFLRLRWAKRNQSGREGAGRGGIAEEPAAPEMLQKAMITARQA